MEKLRNGEIIIICLFLCSKWNGLDSSEVCLCDPTQSQPFDHLHCCRTLTRRQTLLAFGRAININISIMAWNMWEYHHTRVKVGSWDAATAWAIQCKQMMHWCNRSTSKTRFHCLLHCINFHFQFKWKIVAIIHSLHSFISMFNMFVRPFQDVEIARKMPA